MPHITMPCDAVFIITGFCLRVTKLHVLAEAQKYLFFLAMLQMFFLTVFILDNIRFVLSLYFMYL